MNEGHGSSLLPNKPTPKMDMAFMLSEIIKSSQKQSHELLTRLEDARTIRLTLRPVNS